MAPEFKELIQPKMTMNKTSSIAFLLGKIIISLKSHSSVGFTYTDSSILRDALIQVPGFSENDWDDIRMLADFPLDKEEIIMQFEILDNILFDVYDRSYALGIVHQYYNSIPQVNNDDFAMMKLLNRQVLGYKNELKLKLNNYLRRKRREQNLCSA